MNVAKAIEDAVAGRATHEKCMDYLLKAETCGCSECSAYVQQFEKFAGGFDEHIDWVAKYDNIIACLRTVPA